MQMSATAGTMTSVTRARVSASGSEPSAIAPTELSSSIRPARPTARVRYHAPTPAKSVPRTITPTRAICSAPPTFMFQTGLAIAAATASAPIPAVAIGPAKNAVRKGATTNVPTIAADSLSSRTSRATQAASMSSPRTTPVRVRSRLRAACRRRSRAVLIEASIH